MTTRREKVLRLGVVGVLLGGLAASAAPSAAADLAPYPGSLPDTPSAVDVSGRGTFDGLKIHVNQTDDLTTQAVSVTWSWPGRTTKSGTDGITGQAYTTNVLRIMQCWGDPVTGAGTDAVTAANYVAADPGPAREHCEYGGSLKPSDNVTLGFQQLRSSNQYTTKAPTAYGQETAYPPQPGYFSDIPFVAANGTVVPHQTTRDERGISVYSNPYYDNFSTNESPANYTFGPDGRGGLQFQVQNAVDARGLGCGAAKTGGTGLNKCWLAIVPQGETDLNGSSLETRPGSGTYKAGAFASPLASTTWANRIVVPLDFLPSTTACASADNTYSTLGSPLVSNALLSWQSKLCGTSGTVFNYAQGTDARSRDALASGTTSMQFVSNPVPAASATTPITYAPVTLSGVGLAFVWDKALQNSETSDTTPGQPLPTINLDQRLVAKLLTYSYQLSNIYRLGGPVAESTPAPSAYTWLSKNPTWLGADPEFLALNPDLENLPTGQVLLVPKPSISSVQGPLDGSDGIRLLWKWVMSDPDARDFMAGKPDAKGMTVDPWYSTDATINPTGFAFATDIDGLPYADPWSGLPGNANRLCAEQSPLSMSDIWPAARDLSTVAKDILTTNPLEKYTGSFVCPGPTVGPDNPIGWKTSRSGVVIAGSRQLMGFTDTASGNQFGVTFASLKNAAGDFVSPTPTSIAAAGDHLAETGVKGVQQPDLATTDPAAYPLSLLGYAGVTTIGTPADACAAYAELLDYAATDGQTAGTSIGDLPPGYVPLSATLRAQTSAAAKTVALCAQTVPAGNTDTPTGTPGGDAPGSNDTGGGTSADGDLSGGSGPVDPGDGGTVGITGAGSPSSPAAEPVSLADVSRTKPDPSAFAYVVPIALGVGLLALLTAPLSGLRRRRPGGS